MKYKNISKHELTIPEVGVIARGDIFDTDIDINNVNIERIETLKEHSASTHPAHNQKLS